MKSRTISVLSIFLFIISFFLLENIMLNQEFTFNYYRYILINIFRVNKILSPPEYGLTHIFFYSILLYSILNLNFPKVRNFIDFLLTMFISEALPSYSLGFVTHVRKNFHDFIAVVSLDDNHAILLWTTNS